jgi:anti-anti-sigma factor
VAALRASAAAGADGPIVALSGEADATTAAELRETLATQLRTGARLLIVDASGLKFLDSASLRVLILAARALKGRHGYAAKEYLTIQAPTKTGFSGEPRPRCSSYAGSERRF